MSKKVRKTREEIRKDKQDAALPYWPSVAYMNACLSQIKQKGVKGKKSELTSLILKAYWVKREEILNN